MSLGSTLKAEKTLKANTKAFVTCCCEELRAP
jgi:hypothetical protein